ncbi:phytoene/squalene synthase family protein [Paenibacillus sp. PFR10]|uniref:Phytoene/squalene synthase family protein n=2 Tax=Paenibacillus TaxID=44249 RepID=A0ABU3RCY1_9BACL|nr:phytoene/squalene synthase family protein [Paenibacillus sp. PFR10]MDU0202117.1 phytoene/squalene synthase family protein [Paenibacillus sp. PFR10]
MDQITTRYLKDQEVVNMDSARLQADFAYCETIIKKHSKSFYYAFSQLPKEKANAVYAIYAFCRTADDCADSNQPFVEKLESLQRLKKDLDLFRTHAELDHPLWRALRQVFTDYNMDIQPFYDQLTGQWMDMNFTIPQNMHELESYSYYVAGSVGLMLLPVLASRSAEELRPSAIDLGTAMQITNILRDIGEDLHTKERIYLPEEEMERSGYTQKDLRHGLINENFVRLWERLAERAESLYNLSYSSIDLYDDDSKMPLLLSVGMYRGILDAVRSNNYDCFSKRNFVTKENMIKISAAVYNCS